LQLDAATPARRDALVSRLMKDIRIVPTGKGNVYDISYRGQSPEQARRLVEATLEMFVSASADQKRLDARQASEFIEEQIRSHEAKLLAAEDGLKQFRTRNFGVSGVSEQAYYSRVAAATEQVDRLQVALRAAVQGRDAYRRELAREDPQLPQEAAWAELAPSEPARRLEAQRSTLDNLRGRYTDLHPDVVTARRTLAQLEAEGLRRWARLDPGRGGRSAGAATSPVYQRLRIALAEAEAEVASLASQLSTKQAQLAQVRSLANRAPQVEAEHAQLNRDYDIVRKNYDSLVARRESALLGERLDASAQLADFRVTEPPRVSATPAFPSRFHLAWVAALVALACGVAAAQAAEWAAPTVDDMAALRGMSGRLALGPIGMVLSPEARHHRRMATLGHGLALALLLGMQTVWIGWQASPGALH
jgi:polysaccharide chain length determinant protein (PEP-CTERM system associated)